MDRWVWCLILTGAAALAFFNSLPGEFYFDDHALMLDNPRVTSFSYWSFAEHYGGRPLTLLSLYWTHQLAGREPFWYHSINIFLHVATAVLLFLLLDEWVSSRRLALLAALCFTLHPLQTQAVNYVWARSVLLMALFGIVSVWLARYRPWLALLGLQLAVWSRTEALVLIPVLAAVHWMPRATAASRSPVGPGRFGLALLGLGSLNLVGFLVGLTRHAPLEMAWNHSAAWQFWLQQPVVVWKYLSLMLWPSGLSIDHPWELRPLWSVAVAAAALALTAGLLWRSRKRWPVPAYGGMACLLLLLPAAAVPNAVFFSESRTYFAMAGFSVAAAWTLERLWQWRPAWGAGLAVVALLACGWQTLERNRLWNDELGLWEDAVSRAPGLDRVRYNLGFALARKGQTERAETQFRLSRDLNPADHQSYAALAYCAEVRGRLDEADRLYRQALFLNPSNRYAQLGLLRVLAANRAVPASPPGSSTAPLKKRQGDGVELELRWAGTGLGASASRLTRGWSEDIRDFPSRVELS